ncbi:ragulator complex protein LAMTOR4 homolog isoform X1 [Bombus affinis]|uniref:ragulator complex protein LAMTOR4 homolog isoform X1 n=2 Tax=Bombus affinis TaxID=309941 RepID=UPI002144FC28|nr:ragulator complex protein LAMTOR4 homolog isoform X1 [Bombus affinis]
MEEVLHYRRRRISRDIANKKYTGKNMLSLERIPDQIGHLILTEDGAVLTSGGELENDERFANIVIGLVTLTNKVDPKAFANNETFDKISITYPDHCYIICLSNKKIHVVKKKLISSTTAAVEQPLIDV